MGLKESDTNSTKFEVHVLIFMTVIILIYNHGKRTLLYQLISRTGRKDNNSIFWFFLANKYYLRRI